ncbi:MAG: SPOR domain-containing protein [Candidatus Marinimicrobia bacterium]|nr:SPOR domain-containing protein [Candidatus Neomarinimicrobiota bacterium]MCF7850686.1 SPOR domain-containing protein [Candidatus Neomarinimicrobiota bacterium]
MKPWALISLLIPLLVLGQEQVILDESFDPTTLSDWGDTQVRIERVESLSEFIEGMGDQDLFADEEEPPFVFRVQLASTKDMEQAKTIEEHALQAFEEEVIVHFDSPFYKIRVGKMNNREDAQNLQQRAIETGYRRSWVIRTVNAPAEKDRIEE